MHLAFAAEWVDKFGKVETKPHLHACMDRATFEKIVFENLKPDAVFVLFQVQRVSYPGASLRTP